MATRTRGPLAGLGWLKNAINIGYGNPKAVLGGAALVALLSLVPSLFTLPIQYGAAATGDAPGAGALALIMGISVLGGLLLVPAFAGYLGIVDAVERGRSARALDVFAPYRNGETLRLMGYGLGMLAVYAVSFGIVIAAAGAGAARWYMQAISDPNAAAAIGAMPDGLGVAFALALALGLLVMGVYAISLGQVALGGRNVLGSIGDGIVGSLKNVLPLLVLLVCTFVAVLIGGVVFALLAGLVAVLAKFVGAWLMVALLAPLYLGLMLVMFAVMFGVIYHLWRDVCGESTDDAEAVTA